MVEVLKALTPRLSDSQSNLKPLAASAIAELACSLATDAGTKVCRLLIYPYILAIVCRCLITDQLLLTTIRSDVCWRLLSNP